jgi:hypothetical protein
MTTHFPFLTVWETRAIRCTIGIEPEQSRWVVTLADRSKNQSVLQLCVDGADEALAAADSLRDSSLNHSHSS